MNRISRHGNVSGQLLLLTGIACLCVILSVFITMRDDNQEPGSPSETLPQNDERLVTPELSQANIAGDEATTPSATTAESTHAATTETNSTATAPPKQKPVWETWPRPTLALMLTGEQHGFFEPCGCTSNQLGGMSRRANLYDKLTAAGWTVRGLDVGGLARRSVRQAQIKFETSLAALRDLKYIAIGLGPEELRLQPDFLLSQHLTEGDSPLYFLSANLEFFGTADLGTPIPSIVVEEGGLKIGVTSIISDELQKEVLPYPDITWKPPGPALEAALKTFDEQKVDVRILLSQGKMGEAFTSETLQLAEQYPQFDIVLTAHGIGDPDPNAPPKKIGKTLIIESGRKGKYVGVLGITVQDGKPDFRYQLVSLEREDFDDTESMVNLMKSYQGRLKDEQIALTDVVSTTHPSGATFVGAQKCGECHTQAMEIWSKTPHAHAFESLDPSHKRTGFERLNGVLRQYDPECLACHVTGWDPQEYIRFRSGFLNEEFASTPEEKNLQVLMAGNQCENCHGPGSRHIELIENNDTEAARKEVLVTLEQAKQGMCEKCHDSDNSPKFKFDEYWEKVKHYGKE